MNNKNNDIKILFDLLKKNNKNQFNDYLNIFNPGDLDLNIPDEHGNYLINIAILHNDVNSLVKLMNYGATIDIIDSSGYNILYYPIKLNYTNIIDILINHDNEKKIINLTDKHGNFPLLYCVIFNNFYALQKIIDHGAILLKKNKKNINCLHLSIIKKNIHFSIYLIPIIPSIYATTFDGSTILHYICNLQLHSLMEKVLLHDMINIPEHEYNFTPIYFSVIQNDVYFINLAIKNNKYGIKLYHQDYIGNTILHYAAILDHIEILELLINNFSLSKNFKEINNVDQNMFYEKKNNIININISNNDNLNILHILFYKYDKKYDNIINKLLPFINLNSQDIYGNTVLHLIAEKKLWGFFEKILINKKMNIFIKNYHNQTVFDFILLNNNDSIKQIIIKSYFNYLKKYPNLWIVDWQNSCSNSNLNQDCIQLIKNSIFIDKIPLPIKKNNIDVIVELDPNVNFSSFIGSNIDLISGFKYLVKKYSNTTSIFCKNVDKTQLNILLEKQGLKENINQTLFNIEIIWIYPQLFLPYDFQKILINIINNSKFKYFIIPIGIIMENGNHSNGIFVDIENSSVERFEPHGMNHPHNFDYNYLRLDYLIQQLFKNIFELSNNKAEYKYYSPKYYFNTLGFQIYESVETDLNYNIGDPNGFCMLWTIWYLDYRIKYSFMKPDKLIKKMMQYIRSHNMSFKNIIRNYSSKITSLRDYYLNHINKNINDYINNRITIDELDILSSFIINDHKMLE